MPDSPKVMALYRVSDNTMLERVATIQDLFEEDLADFTGFDADFNEGFHSTWVADREAAEALPTDESIQDDTRILTEAVDAAMAVGRDKWVQIKYFIEKAFPGSPATLNVFGADDYRKASVVQKDFIGFLENLHTKAQATAYHAKLIAAKYLQPQIDEILTLRDNLFSANRAQEDWKKDRLKATEDRRNAMNKVYITVLQVNKAAQIVYINSEAKRSQYVFDPNGESGGGTDYSGTLAPGETKTIATVTYAAGTNIAMEDAGDTPLEYSLRVEEGTVGGNPVDLTSGATQTATMGDMNDNPAATFLVVQNLGVTAGTYAVTVGS